MESKDLEDTIAAAVRASTMLGQYSQDAATTVARVAADVLRAQPQTKASGRQKAQWEAEELVQAANQPKEPGFRRDRSNSYCRAMGVPTPRRRHRSMESNRPKSSVAVTPSARKGIEAAARAAAARKKREEDTRKEITKRGRWAPGQATELPLPRRSSSEDAYPQALNSDAPTHVPVGDGLVRRLPGTGPSAAAKRFPPSQVPGARQLGNRRSSHPCVKGGKQQPPTRAKAAPSTTLQSPPPTQYRGNHSDMEDVGFQADPVSTPMALPPPPPPPELSAPHPALGDEAETGGEANLTSPTLSSRVQRVLREPDEVSRYLSSLSEAARAAATAAERVSMFVRSGFKVPLDEDQADGWEDGVAEERASGSSTNGWLSLSSPTRSRPSRLSRGSPNRSTPRYALPIHHTRRQRGFGPGIIADQDVHAILQRQDQLLAGLQGKLRSESPTPPRPSSPSSSTRAKTKEPRRSQRSTPRRTPNPGPSSKGTPRRRSFRGRKAARNSSPPRRLEDIATTVEALQEVRRQLAVLNGQQTATANPQPLEEAATPLANRDASYGTGSPQLYNRENTSPFTDQGVGSDSPEGADDPPGPPLSSFDWLRGDASRSPSPTAWLTSGSPEHAWTVEEDVHEEALAAALRAIGVALPPQQRQRPQRSPAASTVASTPASLAAATPGPTPLPRRSIRTALFHAKPNSTAGGSNSSISTGDSPPQPPALSGGKPASGPQYFRKPKFGFHFQHWLWVAEGATAPAAAFPLDRYSSALVEVYHAGDHHNKHRVTASCNAAPPTLASSSTTTASFDGIVAASDRLSGLPCRLPLFRTFPFWDSLYTEFQETQRCVVSVHCTSFAEGFEVIEPSQGSTGEGFLGLSGFVDLLRGPAPTASAAATFTAVMVFTDGRAIDLLCLPASASLGMSPSARSVTFMSPVPSSRGRSVYPSAVGVKVSTHKELAKAVRMIARPACALASVWKQYSMEGPRAGALQPSTASPATPSATIPVPVPWSIVLLLEGAPGPVRAASDDNIPPSSASFVLDVHGSLLQELAAAGHPASREYEPKGLSELLCGMYGDVTTMTTADTAAARAEPPPSPSSPRWRSKAVQRRLRQQQSSNHSHQQSPSTRTASSILPTSNSSTHSTLKVPSDLRSHRGSPRQVLNKKDALSILPSWARKAALATRWLVEVSWQR